MPNAKIVKQVDFTSGEQNLLPSNQLKKDASEELINLVPGQDRKPLSVRGGIRLLNDPPTGATSVCGLHRFVQLSGAQWWMVATNAGVYSDAGAPLPESIPVSSDARWALSSGWTLAKNISISKYPNCATVRANSQTATLDVYTTVANQRVDFIFSASGLAGKLAPIASMPDVLLTIDGVAITNGNALAGAAFHLPNTIGRRVAWTVAVPVAGHHTFVLTPVMQAVAPQPAILAGAAIRPPATAYTVRKTWTTPGLDVSFATLNNKVFFTNGNQPIQMWDGVAATSIDVTDRALAAPIGDILITFRKRLWLLRLGTSQVYYCSSSDEGVDRWKNWSGTLDSDGGNFLVGGDDGQTATGLGFIFNGVVVFKQRATYLISYGDEDSPAAGKVEVLVPGVGCVAHSTIAYHSGALLFLGQGAEGNYAVYRLQGSGVDDVSMQVPEGLQRILANSVNKPRAVIHDNCYIISADDADAVGSGRTFTYAYDLRRNAWFEIAGWNVGAYEVDRGRGKLYVGAGNSGNLYEYPNGTTDDGIPITWSYKSKQFSGGDEFADYRWRNIWADFIARDTSDVTVGYSVDGAGFIYQKLSLSEEDVPHYDDGVWMWGDGTQWASGNTEHRVNVPIALNRRGRTLQIHAKGTADTDLALARVGVAFRDRKDKYNV